MKTSFLVTLVCIATFVSDSAAQQRPPHDGPPPHRRSGEGRPPHGERGGRPPRGAAHAERHNREPNHENLGESSAELGSSGIVWYPILRDGLAEAKRSNKPIFFMAAASQCAGISGVF